VGAVNCDTEQALCTKYNIKNLPAMKLLVEGQTIEYELGALSAKQIHQFIMDNMPNDITNIRRPEQATEFLTKTHKENKMAAMLFTAKYETSLLYKSLAHQYKSTISFGEIRASNPAVSSRYGVTKYPTLLIFCEGGEDHTKSVEYSGDLNPKDVRTFVNGMKNSKGCLALAKKNKREAPPACEYCRNSDSSSSSSSRSNSNSPHWSPASPNLTPIPPIHLCCLYFTRGGLFPSPLPSSETH